MPWQRNFILSLEEILFMKLFLQGVYSLLFSYEDRLRVNKRYLHLKLNIQTDQVVHNLPI